MYSNKSDKTKVDSSIKSFGEKYSYYIWLIAISIAGLLILLHRSRLGVDFTDEAWYVSDPYWVAKGSIPYVNNWTQASGFTLPLYLFYYCFLAITGGNEGIVLFSRVLFCLWKTGITVFTFWVMKKAQITVAPILALPIIIYNPAVLYDINYNSIGWSYSLLIMALLAMQLTAHEKKSKHDIMLGTIAGALMGRCIIGTPHTLVVCGIIVIILFVRKNFTALKGFILGGVFCMIAVVLFCIMRAGFREFIIGIQYYYNDLGYGGKNDIMAILGAAFVALRNHVLVIVVLCVFAAGTWFILHNPKIVSFISLKGVRILGFLCGVFAMAFILISTICGDIIDLSFLSPNMAFLINYIVPVLVSGIVIISIRILFHDSRITNVAILLLACFFILIMEYYLYKYSAAPPGIGGPTKYGWFVPFICACYDCEKQVKRKLLFVAYLSVVYFVVFVFQGMTVLYGMENRAYWNYAPMIFGIYSIYVCADQLIKDHYQLKNITLFVLGIFTTVMVVRGGYNYVYREEPIKNLTAKVDSGIWKGCYTSKGRADTVLALEKYIADRTEESDQVFCWGHWAVFVQLMSKGQLCSPGPLGVGQISIFDVWHMYQVVPNRIFVNMDELDSRSLLNENNTRWVFISKFYREADSIEYVSYLGPNDKFRLIEYDIADYEAALSYADEMASEVYEFD